MYPTVEFMEKRKNNENMLGIHSYINFTVQIAEIHRDYLACPITGQSSDVNPGDLTPTSMLFILIGGNAIML